jgi:signal transduction histidine kinase
LPGNDLTGWGTCSKSRRGELLFAGFAGAVAFVPTTLQEVPLTAPLVLTDFEIDGARVRIGRGRPLERAITYSKEITLRHDERNFSVTFAGLRYSRPETTRYRYRLLGLDSTWYESPSSIRQATYTTLPADRYTLEVQMAAERGDWRTPGISLDIRVLPAWWATWWFRALAAAALVAVVAVAVRARIRHVAQQLVVQIEARNNERMRIAQDLHDTLLQGLLSASFQLSVAHDQLAPGAKARPVVERVSSLLRQLVTEGRNAVRGMRTWNFETEDLENAISAVPGDLQIESPAEFRVVIEGNSRPLLSAARAQLYLIAREAISNALRHAQASAIEVTLEYRPDQFRLTVRDDGCGFAAAASSADRANHFGLSVMSERAEQVGAAIAVTSGIGVGTEVVLSLPARAIFRTAAKRESPGTP